MPKYRLVHSNHDFNGAYLDIDDNAERQTIGGWLSARNAVILTHPNDQGTPSGADWDEIDRVESGSIGSYNARLVVRNGDHFVGWVIDYDAGANKNRPVDNILLTERRADYPTGSLLHLSTGITGLYAIEIAAGPFAGHFVGVDTSVGFESLSEYQSSMSLVLCPSDYRGNITAASFEQED